MKGKVFAEGKNENGVKYILIIESENGEILKIGVVKDTPNDIQKISVIGLDFGDVMSIIEKPIREGTEFEFGSDEERKKLTDIVGNDYVRMEIK